MTRLRFDDKGWWDAASRAALRTLEAAGNAPGWYGYSTPPTQEPFFVSGASTPEEAVKGGMPADAAARGRRTTPALMLD